MTLPGLPAGLTARPLSLDDTAAVHALTAAYEQALLGEEVSDLEDFEGDFARPSFDPAQDAVLVHDGDDLVAWGEVYRGRRATVVVHPDHRCRGIGGVLADWAVRRASQVGSNRVGQTVPDADTTATELLSARGWWPLYTSWVLEVPPGSQIAPRPLPDGYRLLPYRPGQDERAAYEVIEQAFDEWPDRDPTSYEDWAAPVLQRPGFEPWQLMLAVTGDDRVVGACHLVVSGDTGWVNQVAVERAQRGKGLAQALLAEAFGAARERGAPRGELSTDSRTGALSLYERLGMQVKSSFTHWATAVS
jgi:mycothiol synthase